MTFSIYLINKRVFHRLHSFTLVACLLSLVLGNARVLAQAAPDAPAIPPAAPAAGVAPPVGTPTAPPKTGVDAGPIYPAAEPGVVKAESPKAPTVTLSPGKGFTITSADERFASTVRSRIQLRDTA